MTDSLTVGDRNYSAEDIIPLLRQYGLMPQLIRELVIDHAIAAIELTEEEQARAQARFDQTFNIQSDEQRQSFAAQRQLSPEAFAQLMLREEKLTKFKLETWGAKLESYFLQRKSSLDRVLYSLIRTQEPGLAQELYFRINDDGQPFADLAREYSEGQEAQTGGLIGPVELSVPHPSLARILSISQPGQLWPPTRVGEWFVVVRLEKFLPAKMDDATLQRLLDELFSVWLKEEIEKNMG
ncbi:MAG: peptidylprolyl isomerase, partial [Cyanobacteria bacterium Co-bin8]|nr:peptidylprolyl isomerase [Cyanobacteria bacterium Co-bin8]